MLRRPPLSFTNCAFSIAAAMSKRELEMLSSSVDVNAPRAKRRKDATTSREDKRDVQMADVVAVKAEGNEETPEADTGNRDAVKEQGLQLWQALKDAADKECVTCFTCLIQLRSTTAVTCVCLSCLGSSCISQGTVTVQRLPLPSFQTTIFRLLQYHQEASCSGPDPAANQIWTV